MSEAWSQWQGQLIDGKFHLKQYLGGTGESGVFLAHLSNDFHASSEAGRPVAIRLIADSANAELQLSRWRMAQGVSHPHLLKIIDTGRCRLGGIDLIYALVEYAEESLAQIIPQRPLTVEETRQMLGPALDALTYLHGIGLVHGHLMPSHIMAIADELKLTTDGICPADQPVEPSEQADPTSSAKTSAPSQSKAQEIHDAPETRRGSWSPAADVWSLGVTLAEVLTQHLPIAHDLGGDADSDPLLPENLPVEFVEIVRGCLRRDLRLRWTIPAIRARLAQPAPVFEAAAVPSAPLAAADTPTISPAVVAASAPAPEDVQPHAPTFAQALKAKPVASEKAILAHQPLARVAAASGQSSSVMTPEPAAPYHLPIPLVPRRADQNSRVFSPSSETVATGEVDHPAETASPGRSNLSAERSKLNAAAASALSAAREQSAILGRALAMPGKALHATAISQAISAARRKVPESIVALRRSVSQLAESIQPRLSQILTLLGPYPFRKLQSLGVAGLVLFAALAALFVGINQFRHKEPKPVSQATTPSPKVVIAHPSQRTSPKRHSSAPAKPNPGTRQSQAQPAVAPVPAQPSAAPPAASNPPAPAVSSNQQNAQPVTLRSEDGVRRIDDGGAVDEDNEISDPRKRPSRNNVVPKTANPAVAVDGVQQILPDVSRSALNTIHGTVRVNVRVRVDRSGNVAGAELASSGPSRYFARKSLEAAQNWKFAPSRSPGSPMLVHFEFRSNGTRAFATRIGS